MDKPKTLAQVERDAELEDNYKKKKYVTLFKSRVIISKIGTMEERRVCKNN